MDWIRKDIAESLAQLQPGETGAIALWELMQIDPAPWAQQQYCDSGTFWVSAVIGNRCLYFNDVEEGWGWGRFSQWGRVDGYHEDQQEVHYLVRQMHSVCSVVKATQGCTP